MIGRLLCRLGFHKRTYARSPMGVWYWICNREDCGRMHTLR